MVRSNSLLCRHAQRQRRTDNKCERESNQRREERGKERAEQHVAFINRGGHHIRWRWHQVTGDLQEYAGQLPDNDQRGEGGQGWCDTQQRAHQRAGLPVGGVSWVRPSTPTSRG